MKKHLLGILILAVIMIALPLRLRFAHNNPTMAGSEPYYHARMAMEILSGIPQIDKSITNGREYVLQPYHLILALAYKTLGTRAFNLMPIVFAMSSFIFYFLLLRKLKVPESNQPWILLAYALSPPLIAVGAISTPHSFVLALLISGTWLMLGRWWWLGIINFIIASLAGLVYNLAAIAFLLILMLIRKRTKPIILATIISLTIFIGGHHPASIELPRGVMQYISDIGGTYGFSIFAFLLAIVGAALSWRHKKAYYGAYTITLLFLTGSFFYPDLLVFANVIISALAGVALATLAQRKWKLTFLRQGALLVLFCGLLFSGIAHAVNIADAPPSPEFFKALNFPQGTVLTHENYGFWVEAAGHKAVIDPLWKKLPEPEDQKWDVAAMFSSTDLVKTNLLLKKYNVTHILITPEMQHGLLWEREELGLAFLVENSETFKKLETGSRIRVWRVK